MKYLGFKDLLALCKSLACSQGFYGRLYRDLLELDEDEIAEIERVMQEKKFTDDLDIILWLES